MRRYSAPRGSLWKKAYEEPKQRLQSPIYRPRKVKPVTRSTQPPAPVPVVSRTAPPPHAAPPPYAGYMSPAQMRAAAMAEAQAASMPARQELTRQQAAEAARAKAQSLAIQGFATAAAGMQSQAAPAINAIYSGAAGQTAEFAKGFSDGLQKTLGAAAGESNAFINNVAGGGQNIDPSRGVAAADVAYGLGGYIPASTMTREGAAFGAAAAAWPKTTLARAADDLKLALYNGEMTQKQYDSRLRDLAIQEGANTRVAMQRLKGEQFQRQTYAENRKIQASNARAQAAYQQQRLALQEHAAKLADLQFQLSYARTEIDQKRLAAQITQENRTWEATQKRLALQEASKAESLRLQGISTTGYDPATGNYTPAARKAIGATTGYDPQTGKPIPKKPSTGPSPAVKQDAFLLNANKIVTSVGRAGLGKLQKNPNYQSTDPLATKKQTSGKWLMASGEPTNNPKKAARVGRRNYIKVFEQVYSQIAPTLIHQYGWTDTRVRGWLTAKLRQLGYQTKK